MTCREWVFTVRSPNALADGEVMCLSGSVPSLGSWNPKSVIKMARKHTEGSDDDIWTCAVTLPCDLEVKFRYCVLLFVHYYEGKELSVVKRWETNVKPRKIRSHDVCDVNSLHEFGFISPEKKTVHTGWLTGETLIELKLYEKAISIWKKKHQGKRIFVKVSAVDVTHANNYSISVDDVEESIDYSEHHKNKCNKLWPIVNVAKFETEVGDCEFHTQDQFGVAWEESPETFISFQAQVFDMDTVAFLVDFFAAPPSAARTSTDEEHSIKDHIGSCYVLPQHLKSTEGRMQTTIVSKRFQPIGQFCAVYLIVKPLEEDRSDNGQPLNDFSVTYAHHWKPHWKGLDVGHRGLGNSFSETAYCSNIRENTIASLNDAISHGADMVEFDVQLSKDLVPVIYHNFELYTAVQNKKGEQKMLVKMPMKNFTLKELQEMKTHSVEELEGGIGLKDFCDDQEDHSAFPTLERALQRCDPHAGFNIEIKWDMELADGNRECSNQFEMNLFLDIVVKTALRHAGQRKIIFSTFNPDVCTVLRCKQNRYPVLYLTQAETPKYEAYRDPRSWSLANASRFAKMAEILGINAIADEVLKRPQQVAIVKELGQILFVWTDDRNDKETVTALKRLGIDGIVYDRMDMNNDKEVKESIFMVEKRREDAEEEEEEEYAQTQIRSSSPANSCGSCGSSRTGDSLLLGSSPPESFGTTTEDTAAVQATSQPVMGEA